jgi:site-specific DNA-methyltransferase (adenine-specific)
MAKVPYIEQKQYDIGGTADNIKRIKTAVNTEMGLNKILEFLQSNASNALYKDDHKTAYYHKFGIAISNKTEDAPRLLKIVKSLSAGMNEKSIIELTNGKGTVVRKDMPKIKRYISTTQSIKNGLREKSIIELSGTHYNQSHPTEKLVRLAERLLALISEPCNTIYDPFMGSGSFGVACLNTGRKYIGSEMKPEYFEIACKRIKEAIKQYEKA